MIKNYGFVAPDIERGHYVLGGAFSLPKILLQESMQWDAYLPEYEPQFGEGWDTHGCTIWGTLNAKEILEKRVFGEASNDSERFTYIATGTRPPGNNPHVVADSIRDDGVVRQDRLPMTKSFEEFIQPDPLPRTLVAEAKLWARRNNFGHEWVFQGDHSRDERTTRMMEMLKYSPLGVSVTAWFEQDGVYVDNGMPNTHWCVCYGFTDKGWKIFDSYDHSTKIYSFDANISFCKRYHLTRPASDRPVSLWQRIINLIKGITW